MKIDYFEMNQKELEKRANGLLVGDYHYGTFCDFAFFAKPDLIMPNDSKFIVALDSEIKSPFDLLGVIKYGEKEIKENLYTLLQYIDVKDGFKRHGIAKGLLQKMNETEILHKGLVYTRLSKEGKEARIDLKFEKYLTNYNVLSEVMNFI